MRKLNKIQLASKSATASLALAAFCLLGTAAAHAEDSDDEEASHPIYVQVDMGFSPESHTNFEGVPAGSMHHDGSIFPASLTIGLKPKALQSNAGGFAIELSAYTRDLSVDSLTIGTTSRPADGRVRVGGLMANLRYEMNLGGGIHPYLTGGAGVACTKITDLPTLKLKDEKAKNADFAAHFGAGIGFQPKAFGPASLWLGYDVMTVHSPRFDTQFGIVPNGSMSLKRVLPQTITLGARYAF